MDLLGNRRFKRSRFVICDWWISIRFVCFCVSRFIACDRNYDWRQQKTQLWRQLLNFKVRMFVKSVVRTLTNYWLGKQQHGGHLSRPYTGDLKFFEVGGCDIQGAARPLEVGGSRVAGDIQSSSRRNSGGHWLFLNHCVHTNSPRLSRSILDTAQISQSRVQRKSVLQLAIRASCS